MTNTLSNIIIHFTIGNEKSFNKGRIYSMELYYKVRLFLELGIPVLFIVLVIILLIVFSIKSWFDKKFKKNCSECKYYELFDVSSSGGGCRYKCHKHNRIDRHSMNGHCKYIKCNEFEIK
jgi:hypothetical protein